MLRFSGHVGPNLIGFNWTVEAATANYGIPTDTLAKPLTMPSPVLIRRLEPVDSAAYKELRDEMLAAHPEAFTSDAASERQRGAESYLSRLCMDRFSGGQFTLGAWQGECLVGAISCERDLRVKVRHIAHIVGMMVRANAGCAGIGGALLRECINLTRCADGLSLLILSVTAGNVPALRLYERAGFIRYGRLPHAICIDGCFHAKEYLALTL